MRTAILIFLLCFLCPAARAATLNVPADFPKIQDAIDAATNGDTVLVAPGFYIENINFLGKAVTVKSSGGPEATWIRGSKPHDPDYASVATFMNDEGPDSVLEGFTLADGQGTNYDPPAPGWSDPYGGGIFCLHSSPTLIHNTIRNNMANYGGGIACLNFASPLIEDNYIHANYAGPDAFFCSGGAIYCNGKSKPLILNNRCEENFCGFYGGAIALWSPTTIAGNHLAKNACILSGGSGGGIFSGDISPLLEDNVIEGNSSAYGGGICCTGGSPEIKNNRVLDNEAKQGGGLYIGGGGYTRSYFPLITGNTIAGNSASSMGGGIYMEDGTLLQNVIQQNIASTRGGGLYLCGGVLEEVVDCLIAKNKTWQMGGGIFVAAGGRPIIQGTTVAENEAINGKGLYIDLGTEVTVLNSVLWDDPLDEIDNLSYYTELFFCDVRGGWPGTGNLDVDPQFADPAADDFHLLYTSPCRNAGRKPIIESTFDFEGDPRIVDGKADLGADEFFRHLYVIGDKTPGGAIEAKLVGLPGTTPLALLFGSGVLETPFDTKWGRCYLESPWFLMPLLQMQIPAGGILVLPATIPVEFAAPYDLPMQALIGSSAHSLTNLEVLEVR